MFKVNKKNTRKTSMTSFWCCGESACFTQQNHRNFRDMTIFYNMSLHRENIILTEIKRTK